MPSRPRVSLALTAIAMSGVLVLSGSAAAATQLAQGKPLRTGHTAPTNRMRTYSGGPTDQSTWEGRALNYCLRHPRRNTPGFRPGSTARCAVVIESARGLDPFTRGCINALGLGPITGALKGAVDAFKSGKLVSGVGDLFSTLLRSAKEGARMSFGAGMVTCYVGGSRLHVPGLG